jgi:hypothetical protein
MVYAAARRAGVGVELGADADRQGPNVWRTGSGMPTPLTPQARRTDPSGARDSRPCLGGNHWRYLHTRPTDSSSRYLAVRHGADREFDSALVLNKVNYQTSD